MSLFNLTAHLRTTHPPHTTQFAVPVGMDDLTRLWAEILELKHVGIDDDFFDLGGDSLLALELVTRVEHLCGKRLPLSALMQAMTVRKMAEILGCDETSSLWPSLVLIQPGTTRPPLFCVHPIGGNIFCYRGLGRYLGPDQPMYALRARGLDGIQQPHESIEEMARDYILEVRQVQPEGPYFICGHSFGGLVAFEMARQLQAQGQNTALLAVFDSRKPVPTPSVLKCSGALLAKLKLGTLARKGWHRVTWRALRMRHWSAQTFYKLTRRPLPRDLAHVRASDYCARAARRYTPQVYSGRMIFFRAVPMSMPAVYAKVQINWEQLADGGVETHMISCEHQAMISEPHVSVLAAQLKICLVKAQTEFAGAPEPVTYGHGAAHDLGNVTPSAHR